MHPQLKRELSSRTTTTMQSSSSKSQEPPLYRNARALIANYEKEIHSRGSRPKQPPKEIRLIAVEGSYFPDAKQAWLHQIPFWTEVLKKDRTVVYPDSSQSPEPEGPAADSTADSASPSSRKERIKAVRMEFQKQWHLQDGSGSP